MRSATPWRRVRTGRAGQSAGVWVLLLIAAAVAAMLVEPRATPLQPGT